jgi:Holliday junction DNA helicase RuvA
MIAWVEGVLRDKTPMRVVVDVAGVGYELSISLSTFSQLPDAGKTVALYVQTVAREDALLLYGFATRHEKAVFELLLRANRVGPKLAQTILSGIAPDRLVVALREGEVRVLTGVPGVGPKMAERMVVELRDRAAELDSAGGLPAAAVAPGGVDDEDEVRNQVLSALLNLGYPRPHARRVVEAAVAEAGEDASIEDVIRIALRRLSK